MKINKLRSVAHNIADSLASGIGLMIGVYTIEIFKEASQSERGLITVDLLNGKVTEGTASESLAKAIKLYSEALPQLCEKHGLTVADFQELSATYSTDQFNTPRVLVTVQDQKGHRKQDDYIDLPLRHVKVVDKLGRLTKLWRR